MVKRDDAGFGREAHIAADFDSDASVKIAVPVDHGVMSDCNETAGEETSGVDRAVISHFYAEHAPQIAMAHPIERNMGDKSIVQIILQSTCGFKHISFPQLSQYDQTRRRSIKIYQGEKRIFASIVANSRGVEVYFTFYK